MGLILSQFDADDRAKLAAATLDLMQGMIGPLEAQIEAISAQLGAIENRMQSTELRGTFQAAKTDATRLAVIDLAKMIDATRLRLGWEITLADGTALENNEDQPSNKPNEQPTDQPEPKEAE
jgi:hypothetical protein